MSTPETDRARALAFLHETAVRAADRTEPFPGGVALLTAGFPGVWDANYVRLQEPWPGTAEKLHAALARAFDGLGLAHRMVVTHHGEDAQQLAPGLRTLDYEEETLTVMALGHEPSRTASAPVEDVHIRVVRAIRATAGLDRAPEGDEVVDQILRWGLQVHERLHDRWLAAFDDGVPAACARLISHGSVGQVEDVTTLPSRRNRGLASSVVLGGIDRLHAEGVELVLIVVDRDSGPLTLYRDLGFDPLSTITRFRRG